VVSGHVLGNNLKMSRAFTKERDDVLDLKLTLRRPDSNPITAAGLLRLQEQLAKATDPTERSRLEGVLATVHVVAPPADRSAVEFGATVTLDVPGKGEQRVTIVGEDETDIAHGRIGAASPLGKVLLGSHPGDVVVWPRPAGALDVTVLALEYETDDVAIAS